MATYTRRTRKKTIIDSPVVASEKKFAFRIKGSAKWIKVPEAILLGTTPEAIYSVKINKTENKEERLVAENASQAFFILAVFRFLQSSALMDNNEIIETIEVAA
jgi:hypothetical protein